MADGIVPDVSELLQNQLQAVDAYTQAVNQLKYQRAQRQIRSGLNASWQVDPKLQYGLYQALLQRQGLDMDMAMQASNERGLFGAGLANQAESLLRYGNAVEQYQFKQQLMDWENEYQQGMIEAMRAKQAALTANAAPHHGGQNGGGYGGPGGESLAANPPWAPPPNATPLPTAPQQVMPVVMPYIAQQLGQKRPLGGGQVRAM